MYTYKDLKLAVLQKMGMEEYTVGGIVTSNNAVNRAVTAIPSLLNEALQYCATAGRFIVKSFTITQDGTDTGNYKRYALATLATDFYSLYDREIYFDDTDGYRMANNYTLEGDKTLVTDPATVGVWTVYYNAYPQGISAATLTDATEIDVAPEVYALLSSHIAGEILVASDEDYGMDRKSEFEQRRAELKQHTIKPIKATVKVDEARRFL
jgi:hypothetical protein